MSTNLQGHFVLKINMKSKFPITRLLFKYISKTLLF